MMFISRIDLPMVYFGQWILANELPVPVWTDLEEMKLYPSPEDAAEDMLRLTRLGYAIVLEDQ